MSNLNFGLPNPPSVVEYKRWKFLIFDAPTDANIEGYIKEFRSQNVVALVRACDPSYSTDKLVNEGIRVHEMPFPDGGSPNNDVVDSWLHLCRNVYKDQNNEPSAIGVHCVAGLGRAPVLVALALIELGLHYEEAITLIREKRKGAINAKQLKYLKNYKPKKKCIIM